MAPYRSSSARSRSGDEGVRVTVAETVAVIWWSHRRRGGGTWGLRRQRCTLCGLGRGSMTVAEARSAVGEHGRRGRGGRQGPRRGRSAVACRLASSVDYPHVDQLGLIALYIVWFHHVRLRPKPNLNLNSNNQGHDKGTDKVQSQRLRSQGAKVLSELLGFDGRQTPTISLGAPWV